jgi:hypothetical protein
MLAPGSIVARCWVATRGSKVRRTRPEEEDTVTAFIITRIQTGDYDRWRPMFDQDQPRAREKAQVQRVLRGTEDPNEVFIYLEFASLEDANEARERLISSGVLDRFADTDGPTVVTDAG